MRQTRTDRDPPRPSWWTRERVLNGLRRAARDLYGSDPPRLPRDHKAYAADVLPLDGNRVGPRRRFPPASQVFRHFDSMSHAWHLLGFIPAEQVFVRNRHFWTRERMIEAGADFFREHEAAPTNHQWWHEATKGRRAEGLPGVVNKYPSYATFIHVGGWKGMRDFWVDVRHAHPELNIQTDMTDMPWRSVEDWWVVESVGILPRDEVARLMDESGFGRTEAAIKRRLYDLGVNSYNRWGWTINHAERVLGVSGALIRKYMAHGLLPYYRSHKCIYVDPADLLVVKEYNWAKKRHPKELDQAVRKSLIQRACFALLRYDWRRYSYHRARSVEEFVVGSVKPRKERVPTPPTGPKPKHVKTGDWVVITGQWRFKTPGGRERKGEVKSVYWSPHRTQPTQKSPARPPCWMARVELPKLKAHGRPQYPRVVYHVPVSHLERVRKPRVQQKAKRAAAGVQPEAAPKERKRGPLADLTGRVFGRLTVIRRIESSPRGYRQWLCKCECGNEAVVKTSYLTGGNTRSCGCAWDEAWRARNARKFVDLTGRRFGRLTVLAADSVRNKVTQWRCRCDCGTEKVIDGKALKQGLTQSCGCLQRERASEARKRAAASAPRSGGRFTAPAPTRAAKLDDLPKEYGCNLCGRTKPLAEMVVVFVRREKVYRLRPRCKECHNARERGHRREWKREYLRSWRERNKELNDSYWKDNDHVRERSRINASRYVEKHRDALAIRRRLKTRGIEVSVEEAEGLLKKFGRCYPTRFGLTPEGLRECENVRDAQRRLAPEQRLTPLEIRMAVYDEGLFIEPSHQPEPYQHASNRLREYQRTQRNSREIGAI